MKISLDSTVFADQDFIEWLHLNASRFEIFLSGIVALETYHWFNLRNLSAEQFELEINKLGVRIKELQYSQIFTISENAKSRKLRFKHHARDFIIGTHAQLSESVLITNNIRHFDWLGVDSAILPDDLVILITK